VSSHAYHGRWERTRALALKRAGNRCSCCGARRTLVVHHRDEQGMHGARAHDQSNLVVLCRQCHHREHGAMPQRD